MDIEKSINLIEAHLYEVPSLFAYKKDIKTIDAVERRLAIIGEALWQADKMDCQLAISDKKRIIGLMHILVHDYDLIDDDAIWMICKKNIPLLKTDVEVLLNS